MPAIPPTRLKSRNISKENEIAGIVMWSFLFLLFFGSLALLMSGLWR